MLIYVNLCKRISLSMETNVQVCCKNLNISTFEPLQPYARGAREGTGPGCIKLYKLTAKLDWLLPVNFLG